MPISLCIISRKEDEESLKKAISSVQDHVDEVIVTDTTPVTTGCIHLRGFDQEKVRLARFEWTGSFADARNFSFEQAKHDVILWIDSDDIVRNPEKLKDLAKKVEKGDADWVYLEYVYAKDPYGNVTAKHWKPRLIRKGTGKWVGNVHEDLTPLSPVIQSMETDVVIEHETDEEHLVASAKRNLAIQEAEYARDGENTDPRTLQYMAMSYQALGRHEEAVHYFVEHLKKSGSQEDKYWSAWRVGLNLMFLGRNEEALQPLLDSLKLHPEWKTSYLAIADAYYRMEKWDKVIEWTLTGMGKDMPETLQVVSELDYGVLPLGRLAEAYLRTGNYRMALDASRKVLKMSPDFPGAKDLEKMAKEALELEGFVESFLTVTNHVRKHDRTKAAKLFDLIPKELDDDRRIQHARSLTVPPEKWPEKSVAIYCGRSVEEWAYPSIFSGIGGSEEAVINMSRELTKLGYKVTVFNRCGNMKGEYEGVEYRPYYHFNQKDRFDTLIVWRNPLVFLEKVEARRKYLWLHDIAHPEYYTDKIYANVDKILFLSEWHRSNLPGCPEDKAFVTNNGINPRDFESLPEKRPNSLVWTSSYDRGLLPFIRNVLPLIRKEIPDVTLDVAYGWQNIEKEMDLIPHLRELYQELNPVLESDPYITHHGRVSHRKVAQLLGSSMVYPYASEFGETNNITSQKAQAAGCYVVTTPQAGGTKERVRYGSVVDGSGVYSDEKQQKAFAEEVVRVLRSDIPEAYDLKEFSWETTAKQWDNELLK